MSKVKGKKHVDGVTFAKTCKEVFESGGGYGDVAEKLGLAVQSVAQRASAYRKEGYPIPKPVDQRKGGRRDRDAIMAALA